MRRGKHIFLASLTVVTASCGVTGDGETIEQGTNTGYIEHAWDLEDPDAIRDRVDLRINSTLEIRPTRDDLSERFTVTASISSVEDANVQRPIIMVEMSDGLMLESDSEGCQATTSGMMCELQPFDAYEPPRNSDTVEFVLTVRPDATDPHVTITASSRNNPVANDPDPTNNIVTHSLSEIASS